MNDTTPRRRFLKRMVALSTGLSVGSLSRLAEAAPAKTTQPEPEGFFTLGRRKDHWWLVTPEGKPFFTIGLSTLR